MGLTVCALLALGGATLAAQKVIKKTPGQAGSPHETVEYTIHGAKITVAYGRPFIKGRAIDAVAPKGQAYRLGADEATVLTTDKMLMIGSLMLDPGSYSLWAIPDTKGWQLVVNKQTGQWGTDYDAKQDLGRTPLKTADVAKPGENFTITVEEKPSNNGVLNFDWGKTRLTTDFMVH
jgi:Protein of unknown function (DUF2911)